MGVGSAISACLGKVATVLTNPRLRLRFFVVLSTVRQARALPSLCLPPSPLWTPRHSRATAPTSTAQLLEIVTAVIASLQAKKIQALVTHLMTDNGVSATDNIVMAYTLLVCNCSAEAILIVIHFVYGCVRARLRCLCVSDCRG